MSVREKAERLTLKSQLFGVRIEIWAIELELIDQHRLDMPGTREHEELRRLQGEERRLERILGLQPGECIS